MNDSKNQTTRKMTPKELVEEYDRVSKEVGLLEKYRSNLSKKITEYMTAKDLTQLEGHEHTIKLHHSSREILTKNSVPPELWAQYAVQITYPRLYVTTTKGKSAKHTNTPEPAPSTTNRRGAKKN